MLCDRCHKREATIYYTEVINGEKKEQHLCAECASELTNFQLDSPLNGKEMNIGSLLSSILSSYYPGNKEKELTKTDSNICSVCGMTYDLFMQEGKLGCANCYKTFRKVLDKSVRQVQGAASHVGKRPKGFVSHTDRIINELTDIDKLSIRLQDAIEKEEFEEAARLRDQIRSLKEKEGTKNG